MTTSPAQDFADFIGARLAEKTPKTLVTRDKRFPSSKQPPEPASGQPRSPRPDMSQGGTGAVPPPDDTRTAFALFLEQHLR